MSCPTLCSSMTVALQAPLSMRFSISFLWAHLDDHLWGPLHLTASWAVHICRIWSKARRRPGLVSQSLKLHNRVGNKADRPIGNLKDQIS